MRSMLVGMAAVAVLVTAPASAAEEKKPSEGGSKMVCKRFADTGSMIKRRKQCMTLQQWDQVAASQQEGARKLVEDLRTRPEGGP